MNHIRFRYQIYYVCLGGCIIRHFKIIFCNVEITVHPQLDIRVEIIVKCVIIPPRTVVEGHFLFARAHQLDPIGIVGINHLIGAGAVNNSVLDSLDLLNLKIKVTVLRPDVHSIHQASRPQSGNGTPGVLNQLGGMGGQGHPQGPFIIGDPNRYTVAFPVEAPDLDLRRVVLIEFIPLIAVLEVHTDEAIILIPQDRGNTAVSGQVPNILMFPVAPPVLDGVGSTPIHSEGAAGIIPLHQRLADIQINGVDSLGMIHPLHHLCALVAGRNLLLYPVGFQHEVILQLHGGQCIHIGFTNIVSHRKRLFT